MLADDVPLIAKGLGIAVCDFFEAATPIPEQQPTEFVQRVAATVVQAGQEMPDERTYAMFVDFMQWMAERGWRPPEGETTP